jgi:hypothetical protein
VRPENRSDGGVVRPRQPFTAQQKLNVGYDRVSTAARLAPNSGPDEYAAAQRAPRVMRRIGKVPIEGKQKIVESGIGQ